MCPSRRSCTSQSARATSRVSRPRKSRCASTRTARALRTSSATSGAINDTEYKTLKNDGYTLEDQVGKDGVEKIFEKDLRGTPGSITLEVDSAGRVLRELTRTDAIPGRDVQLTIDLRVQALAEDSLATALLNARTRTPEGQPQPLRSTRRLGRRARPDDWRRRRDGVVPDLRPTRVRRRGRPQSLPAAARSRTTTSR